MSRGGRLAGRPLHLEAPRWRTVAGVLPGVIVSMLHSAAIDLPRADLVDALHTDVYRIQWAVGSYILGAATGMAMTRFWGERLGFRRAFLIALGVFSISAALCSLVDDVVEMTPLRLVSGYSMGLVISVGMLLVWRDFTEETELAMAIYGIGVYLAALLGVIFGGLVAYTLSWRWIFLLNAPLGATALWLGRRFLPLDAPAAQRAHFDVVGLGALVAWILSMIVVVDMGQYWGWLTSPFFVPWFVALALALVAFIGWGTRAAQPLIDLRPFGRRAFGLGLAIKAIFSCNVYVLASLLSAYMIALRRYQWWQGGLVILPALLTLAASMIAGALFGRTRNRRGRMFTGLVVMAVTTAVTSELDLYTSKFWLAAVLGVWGAGAGLVIGPTMLTVFEGLPRAELSRTAGVFNITRALPAFVVGTLLVTLWTRHADGQFDRLRQSISFERPMVTQTVEQIAAHLGARGSPPAVHKPQTYAVLGRWIHANASVYAMQRVLLYLAILTGVGAGLVLLLHPVPAVRPAEF